MNSFGMPLRSMHSDASSDRHFQSMPHCGTPSLFSLLYSIFTSPAPAGAALLLHTQPGMADQVNSEERRMNSFGMPLRCMDSDASSSRHFQSVPQCGTSSLFSLLSSLLPPLRGADLSLPPQPAPESCRGNTLPHAPNPSGTPENRPPQAACQLPPLVV